MANINAETKIEGPASNHCDTDVKLRTCNFSWTINKYSFFKKRHQEVLKSAAFSAVDDDLKWYLIHEIVLHKQRGCTHPYEKAYVKLCPDYNVLGTCGGPVSGNVKLSTTKPGSEMKKFLEGSFSFNSIQTNEEKCEFCIGEPDEIQKRIHQDELTILCEVTYMKYSDVVTTSTSLVSTPIKISEFGYSLDFEKILNDEYFGDVTISVEGKNYPGHKAILSARSPVFNTMFRNNMQENQRNHIVIADIDQKTFEEMMRYIYTGKVKNIEESAFELLPFADKYDLKELRIMCENVLFRKLSTDNVARILILADMHHAENLKACALRFIKVNHSKCKDFKETEVWNILTTSRPHLMNDLMKIFFDE